MTTRVLSLSINSAYRDAIMNSLITIDPHETRAMLAPGIFINTPSDFELPKTQAIPMYTRDLSFFGKFSVWLLDNLSELFIEDYYFQMTWLPNQPIIKIPKGFIFDGASVPKTLRALLDSKGILYHASIFHDFGCQYNCWLLADDTIYEPANGREFFDGMFRDFTTIVYDMDVVASIAWAAVRVGGAGAWKKRRAANDNVYKSLNIIPPVISVQSNLNDPTPS